MTVTETWLALVTRVLPKVTYPFMLTRFTKKQLHKLSVILDNVILPKMGVNRKMARAVVYGPLDLGGMEYPSMSTIQDVKGISHFIKHLQWNKEVGTDLRLLRPNHDGETGGQWNSTCTGAHSTNNNHGQPWTPVV